MCTVARLSAAEFWDQSTVDVLIDEYADECATSGLPRPNPDRALYDRLEQCGALHVLGAFDEGEMVGFSVLIVVPNPHYGVPLAVTESLFVAASHRKTGAGLRLIRAGESAARALGAQGMFMSAPLGSRFAEVLEAGVGYRETNRVFFRSLA